MDVSRLLSEFPKYLEENRLAQPHHIPFLVRWVEEYLRAPYDPNLKPDDRLQAFLDQLQHRPDVKDWQVRQADDAVKLLRQLAATLRQAGTDTSAAAPPSPIARPEQTSTPPSRGHGTAPTAAWVDTVASMRKLIRLRHYSPKTETAYLDWARRFAEYCCMRPPATLAEGDVTRYLTHLAMERHVAASTQNQAFNALLFLFRDVLVQPLAGLQDTVRARRGERLPVVFSRDEVDRLFAVMEGTTKLMAELTCHAPDGAAGAESAGCEPHGGRCGWR